MTRKSKVLPIGQSAEAKRNQKEILDDALGMVKPWPILTPGDQDKARKELRKIIWDYQEELVERSRGYIADVINELEGICKSANELNDALRLSGPWARNLLSEYKDVDHEDWERAGGNDLPAPYIEDFSPYPDETYFEDDGQMIAQEIPHGIVIADDMPQGLWLERTAGLASWAGRKISDLHQMAPKMGRKALPDLIRDQRAEDWLLNACAKWMDAHQWERGGGSRTKLTPLARLVHEAATGDKPTPGQFRAARSRVKPAKDETLRLRGEGEAGPMPAVIPKDGRGN
jgi:hypothetical protein